MAVSESLMHSTFYAPQDEYYTPPNRQADRFSRALYDYPYQNPMETAQHTKRGDSADGAMLDLLPSDVIQGLDGLSLDSIPRYDQLAPGNYFSTLLLNQIRGYQFQPQIPPQIHQNMPPPNMANMPPNLPPTPVPMPTVGHIAPNSPSKNSSASEKDGSYRCTWSQTRRVRNLNRPMIPISIKIPLHEKHLWWESPTVTLNMFAPYSTQLVKGEKTIETRNYQLPNKCKGVRIGIVEIMPKGLPSKKPELVGEVVFVDCKEYTSREEWEADAPYHKIDVNHELFGWKKNRKKYGWVVHTWQSYDRTIREAASDYCNTRIHYTKNFFVWAYV